MDDIHEEIVRLRQEGRPAVLVTVVGRQGATPGEVGAKMLVGAGGRIAGTVGGGALEHHAVADAQAVLAGGEPRLQEYRLDDAGVVPGDPATPTGMLCGGRATLFLEPLVGGVRAYLFGAGHVNRALAGTLIPLGFAVTFVDCREEWLADLPAPHLTAGPDYDRLPELPAVGDSHVVVATHSHRCDERVLEQLLLREHPAYLGVVASRRKRDAMFQRLRERHGEGLDLSGLAIPVGLHLGGHTPAALALSIAAEMQAFRHGIGGHRHLRDRV
jgi:xanthine dehydrogenase accessory factor